jgi:hypothetical protein
VVVLAVLSPLATGCGSGASSSSVDPGVLTGRLIAAENSGDVESALALFTDDGLRRGVPGCDLSDCRGQDNLRASFQRGAQVYKVRLTPLAPASVNGITAEQVIEVSSTLVTAAGATRIVTTVVVTERAGRIASEQVVNNISDPQTASYVDYLKGHPLQQIAG